jgi:hypothetical protein
MRQALLVFADWAADYIGERRGTFQGGTWRDPRRDVLATERRGRGRSRATATVGSGP